MNLEHNTLSLDFSHPCLTSSHSSLASKSLKSLIIMPFLTSAKSSDSQDGLYSTFHEDVDSPTKTYLETLSQRAENSSSINPPFSPVKEQPPEILSEIFSRCVLGTVCLDDVRVFTAPWSLTHVCQTWRQLALGMPTLWNDLSILALRYSPKRWEYMKSILKVFLARTSTSLISLEIMVPYDWDRRDPHKPGRSGRPCPPVIESLVHVLQPYLGRINHLSLIPLEWLGFLLQLPGGVVAALESISLTFYEYVQRPEFIDSDYFPTSVITILDQTPHLRKATITSAGAGLHPNALRFPWSQLTHLHFIRTWITFAEGHGVLRQCTNLVSCGFGIATDKEWLPNTPDTILENLESLVVEGKDGDYGRFLQPFVLPALKKFGIHSTSGSVWSAEDLTTLIVRSSCSLERLEAGGLKQDTISALLSQAPSFKELLLLSMRPDHFRGILSTIVRGDLTPNLRTLGYDPEGIKASIDVMEPPPTHSAPRFTRVHGHYVSRQNAL